MFSPLTRMILPALISTQTVRRNVRFGTNTQPSRSSTESTAHLPSILDADAYLLVNLCIVMFAQMRLAVVAESFFSFLPRTSTLCLILPRLLEKTTMDLLTFALLLLGTY